MAYYAKLIILQKDYLVMKKIGNRPITEADTDFFKIPKIRYTEQNFAILCAHFGTVTQCSVEPTVPRCANKIPKFIKIQLKFIKHH